MESFQAAMYPDCMLRHLPCKVAVWTLALGGVAARTLCKG